MILIFTLRRGGEASSLLSFLFCGSRISIDVKVLSDKKRELTVKRSYKVSAVKWSNVKLEKIWYTYVQVEQSITVHILQISLFLVASLKRISLFGFCLSSVYASCLWIIVNESVDFEGDCEKKK